MLVHVKTNHNSIVTINVKLCIGDYVTIKHAGCQYCSYTTAFQYFWGDNISRVNAHNFSKDNVIWKIINIVLHGSDSNRIICHIRNRKGDNVVIGMDGLELAKFHKRNRESIKPIIIYQLPYMGEVMPHDWHEKLWDFYEKGKVVKRKKN